MNTIRTAIFRGAALAGLLLSGCVYEEGPGYYGGPAYGPYYGDYGPYDGGDIIVDGGRHYGHYGGHHFYGHGFGHSAPVGHGGFGGGFHGGGGGFHGGGGGHGGGGHR